MYQGIPKEARPRLWKYFANVLSSPENFCFSPKNEKKNQKRHKIKINVTSTDNQSNAFNSKE
jgi:hypothetical protein